MSLTREQRKKLIDLLLSTPPASTFAGRTALLGGAGSLVLNRDESNSRLDFERVVQQLEAQGARGALAEMIENAAGYVPGTDVAGDLDALLQIVKGSQIDPPPPIDLVDRAAQARLILQWLQDSGCTGVAILEPFGFGAGEMAAEVLRALERPGEPLLPVRLVPELQSTTEERLYGKLLRDLRFALPEVPAWRRLVEDRKEASAMDRFEFAVEDLLDGPARTEPRQLLFVIEGLAHVLEEQLVRWGMLLQRLSNRGLKLLVWGGRELYDLRTRPPSGGLYSAFHVLREVTLGALSGQAVERWVFGAARDEAEAKRAAAVVHELTGGHPALVAEIVRRYPEEVLAGNREVLLGRMLEGEHMTRLRGVVAGDAEIREALRGFAGATAPPIPSGRKRGGARLYWLGVMKDAGPGQWDWAAPVMRELAAEWV